MGAPSRREVGHGMLAKRALEPIFPSEDNFPYIIRVESTITESNGSSSMASVCGGCLALQDAGVPVKCSIAGIAMGLVLDTKEFEGDGTPLILSDITGSEDASGDMDFKVAGNEDGITVFQMDIKVVGITLPIMKQALLQAKDGQKHILGKIHQYHQHSWGQPCVYNTWLMLAGLLLLQCCCEAAATRSWSPARLLLQWFCPWLCFGMSRDPTAAM